MSTAMQQFLDAFDSLAEADKHQATVEILRRLADASEGDLSEDALIEVADELFRALDAEEDRLCHALTEVPSGFRLSKEFLP